MRAKIFLFSLLLCMAFTSANAQQSQTVTGTIKNANGEPLQGVSVTQRATKNTTITDQQGQYKLVVSSLKGMLELSHVGFESQSVPLNSQNIATVVMTLSNSDLGEVVVIGYGTRSVQTSPVRSVL